MILKISLNLLFPIYYFANPEGGDGIDETTHNHSMSTFTIDFFELGFLAEACIPPRPIARTMFWQNLTNKYWSQMTEGERIHLFEWLQKNWQYEESLAKKEDTQIFHARFNPDNQYMVKTNYNDVEETHRAFRMSERYYTTSTSWISEEYIIGVEKFTPKREY